MDENRNHPDIWQATHWEAAGAHWGSQCLMSRSPGLPCPASPDAALLQLAKAGISLQDISNGLLLLLRQEAEVQECISLRLWPVCHEAAGQGPEPLLKWVSPLGHQLGQCPISWGTCGDLGADQGGRSSPAQTQGPSWS